MSISYYANGHGEVMIVILSPSVLWTFPYLWHLSHFLTKSFTSFCIVDQKEPALVIFDIRDLGLK